MDGDNVKLRLKSSMKFNKRSGIIVKILKRNTENLYGTYLDGVVTPKIIKMSGDIFIS
jgi:hypothetical protein